MYTALQVSQYPFPHLTAAALYMDYSGNFVPTSKQALHTRNFETALMELIDLEEEDKESK